ncbi:hypothetical protein EYF80_060658 [Liparis tanakae]|uniref:Secreted protein n=1 Tax=Liparis tanakae TaxID=230148 RepID=A0A4Z2EK53_9TELE|nr:hypothetical protein EYF80_060658 [Liparis tanakae]
MKNTAGARSLTVQALVVQVPVVQAPVVQAPVVQAPVADESLAVEGLHVFGHGQQTVAELQAHLLQLPGVAPQDPHLPPDHHPGRGAARLLHLVHRESRSHMTLWARGQ